jgi:hypothetical protein
VTEPVRLMPTPTPVVTATPTGGVEGGGEAPRPLPRGEPIPVTAHEPPRN